MPRILAWDIETLPIIAPTWRLYKSNIRQDSIIESTSLVCAAWRFVGDKQCKAVSVLDDEKRFKRNLYDDEYVVRTIHDVLSGDVDLLLHQNGDKFDWKKFNARVAYYGLNPLPKFNTIDTLKQARKHFGLDSNKLDFLGRYFGVGEKMDTGGNELWDKIIQAKYPPVGKQADLDLAIKSIKYMVRYNKQDVDLLVGVYERLHPYINTPNLMTYNGNYDGCPKCGSKHYRKNGMRHTSTGAYQSYSCSSCGARFQDVNRTQGAFRKVA